MHFKITSLPVTDDVTDPKNLYGMKKPQPHLTDFKLYSVPFKKFFFWRILDCPIMYSQG